VVLAISTLTIKSSNLPWAERHGRRYADWAPARLRREAARIGPVTAHLVEVPPTPIYCMAVVALMMAVPGRPTFVATTGAQSAGTSGDVMFQGAPTGRGDGRCEARDRRYFFATFPGVAPMGEWGLTQRDSAQKLAAAGTRG
jgi:hypothetical protein